MQRVFGAFLLLVSPVLAEDDNDVLLLQKSLAVETVDELPYGSGSGDGSWFELDGYESGGGGTKPPKGSKKEKGDTPALIQHGSGSGEGSWFELDGYYYFRYGSGSGGGFEPMYGLPYGSGSRGFGIKPPKEQRFAGTHQAPQAPRYGPPKGGSPAPALIQPYGSGSGGGSWYDEFPYGSGSGREGGEYYHSPCDAVCPHDLEKKLEERCGHDDCEAEFAGIDNIPDARKKMEEIGSWLVTEGVSETDVFACGECHLAELDKHGPGYGYPTSHGTKPPKGSKREKGDTPALVQHGSGSGDGSWFELDGYESGGGGTKPPKGSKK